MDKQQWRACRVCLTECHCYSEGPITEIALSITAQDVRDAYQTMTGIESGAAQVALTEEQISRVLEGLLRGHKTRNMPVVNWTFVGHTAKRIAAT